MNDICDDNRFELIEKYKKKLIEATNIETSTEEMKVLDSILFRFWQMGWLDKLDLPSAQPEQRKGTMLLNLNDKIKVKLTDLGKDIYYHQYDRTNKFVGKEICKPSFPKEDENGYTEFQLWCFMELYGPYMGMTLPNVIQPLDLIIEPERKTGRWIYGEKDGQDGWYCSECGGFIPWDYDYYGLDNIDFIKDFKTCPRCDARMISYTGMKEGAQDG